MAPPAKSARLTNVTYIQLEYLRVGWVRSGIASGQQYQVRPTITPLGIARATCSK